MQIPYEKASGLPIDIHYDRWARFENFIKFAEKKELQDRLKELDPPPMSNYIDVETIDNIQKTRRKRVGSRHGRPPKAPREDDECKKEHQARIQKMKELYGMFINMEQNNDDGTNHTESFDGQILDTVRVNPNVADTSQLQ